jgi:hypothetical protein
MLGTPMYIFELESIAGPGERSCEVVAEGRMANELHSLGEVGSRCPSATSSLVSKAKIIISYVVSQERPPALHVRAVSYLKQAVQPSLTPAPPSASWTCPHLPLAPLACRARQNGHSSTVRPIFQPSSHALSNRPSERCGSPRMSISLSVSWNTAGSNSYQLLLNALIRSRISRNCTWTARSATLCRPRGTSPMASTYAPARLTDTQSSSQTLEVRCPQPMKAKWVRVELRKIEHLPGGAQFVDHVGQSPLTVWKPQEGEWGVLHSVSSSLTLLASH